MTDIFALISLMRIEGWASKVTSTYLVLIQQQLSDTNVSAAQSVRKRRDPTAVPAVRFVAAPETAGQL